MHKRSQKNQLHKRSKSKNTHTSNLKTNRSVLKKIRDELLQPKKRRQNELVSGILVWKVLF